MSRHDTFDGRLGAGATPIHGTYPMDDLDEAGNCRWKFVRRCTATEAARLTQLDVPNEQSSPLWINKGFRLIGATHVQPGVQIVYVHNGTYTILERI